MKAETKNRYIKQINLVIAYLESTQKLQPIDIIKVSGVFWYNNARKPS